MHNVERVLIHPSEHNLFSDRRDLWRKWEKMPTTHVIYSGMDLKDTGYFERVKNGAVYYAGWDPEACMDTHLRQVVLESKVAQGLVKVCLVRNGIWENEPGGLDRMVGHFKDIYRVEFNIK